MKRTLERGSLFALILAASLFTGCSPPPTADHAAQREAESKARATDPAWQATLEEVDVIKAKGSGEEGKVQSFCVNADGQILVCWDATQTDVGSGPERGSGIQVFDPDGQFIKTLPLPFGPQAITVAPSGKVFVGGNGRLARLGAGGEIEASGVCPALAEAMMSDEEIRDLIKDWQDRPEDQFERYKRLLANRRKDITGLAATEEEVFVACAAPKGFSYAAYRMDQDFQDAELVVQKLSGCCGQMDITARDGHLWVAHNGRHRVECYDRTGQKLRSFGRADRRAADGFGGCCEPKNIRFTPEGDLLCAESGPPVVIKHFSADGKFIEVLANPTYDSGCVRATVDVSPDGKRYYLLNAGDEAIHVFGAGT